MKASTPTIFVYVPEQSINTTTRICNKQERLLIDLDKAPVVQKTDSAIHRINHYPADKYLENLLRYPLDRDLSDG